MRIGCLQFAPQVGEVESNVKRAENVLQEADPGGLDGLDLLVLPEMAFSGYNFKSLQQITPFLEARDSGVCSSWARTAAARYNCTVAVGYPETYTAPGSAGPERYNSLLVVNRTGETVANYRKSFLYYTDETWASEGGGFYKGRMEGLGSVAMGICMDINPYRFAAPWKAYEFAFHVIEVKANLAVISMAWLTHEPKDTYLRAPQDPDMETLAYWVQRIEPLIRANQEGEIICVFSNRCGVEEDVVYAGTSAVLGVRDGQVSVYGLLGRGSEELLVVNTDLPPFARLVGSSQANRSG